VKELPPTVSFARVSQEDPLTLPWLLIRWGGNIEAVIYKCLSIVIINNFRLSTCPLLTRVGVSTVLFLQESKCR